MADSSMSDAILWLKRRKICVLIVVFSMVVSGLIINALELCTLPLYFIRKRLYRQINARIVYFHWCLVPWWLESWANYKIRVFVHDKKEVKRWANKEHSLVVLNHSGDLDWMVGWCLIEKLGMLGGTKAIMKDIAKYLPGIGWTFLFMEYPFLKRDWKQDEEVLKESCKNLGDYPVSMLLCLFAEGTRFTEEKHRHSMEFARSRGLPVLKHHLLPRTKGFCFLVNHLREAVPAVYDVTISYRKGEPSMMGVINAEPCEADIMLRRFDMSEVPTESDEAMADWLIKLYQDKDELVDYHKKHKSFPGELADTPKRIWPDVVMFIWLLFLGIPAFLSALYLFWIGSWFTLCLIILAVILADQLFQYVASVTDTKRTSSSYGLTRAKRSNGTAATKQE